MTESSLDGREKVEKYSDICVETTRFEMLICYLRG